MRHLASQIFFLNFAALVAAPFAGAQTSVTVDPTTHHTIYGAPELESFSISAVKPAADSTQSSADFEPYRQRYQRLFKSKEFKSAVAKIAANHPNSNVDLDDEGTVIGRMHIGPLGQILDLESTREPKLWALTPNQGLNASRSATGTIFDKNHEHDDVANKQAHTIIGSIPGTLVEHLTGSPVIGALTSTLVMFIHETIPDPNALRNSKGHRIADMDPADMTGNIRFWAAKRLNVGCQYAMDGTGACTFTRLLGPATSTQEQGDPNARLPWEGMSKGIR